MNKNDIAMANAIIHTLKYQTIRQQIVPPRLADWYEYFWMVSWDVPENESRLQQLLTEPKADIYLEKDGVEWKLSKIRKTVFTQNLQGRGAVFGIKLRPATQHLFESGKLLLPTINFDDAFETNVQKISIYLSSAGLELTDEMKLVNHIIDTLAGDKKIKRIAELQERFELEPRRMQRLFNKYIGLSVKWIICRYRTLEALKASQGENVDWSKIAYDLGFSDQAHFIRDFKRNLNFTPDEYNRLYKAMSRF